MSHLFTGITHPLSYVVDGFHNFRLASLTQTNGMGALLLCAVCIFVLLIHDFLELKVSAWDWLARFRKPIRYAFYFLLLFVVLYSRQLGEYAFVYFQF